MLIVKSYLLQTSNACLELELYGEVGHSVVLLPGAGGGIRGFREIGADSVEIDSEYKSSLVHVAVPPMPS